MEPTDLTPVVEALWGIQYTLWIALFLLGLNAGVNLRR